MCVCSSALGANSRSSFLAAKSRSGLALPRVSTRSDIARFYCLFLSLTMYVYTYIRMQGEGFKLVNPYAAKELYSE